MRSLKLDVGQAFDDFPQFVFLKDEHFQFVYINKSLAGFFDWDRNAIIGKTDFDVFKESVARSNRKEDEQVFLESSHIVAKLNRHIGKDGSERWIRSEKSLITIEGKSYVLGMSTDLTREKEQIRQADQLQQFESVIHRISNSLLGIEDEEELCWKFASEALSELELEDLVLYLSNNKEKTLQQVSALGGAKVKGRQLLDSKVYTFDMGVVGRAASTMEAQVVGDTRHDPDYVIDDQSRLSELAVPIIAHGELIGVLDSEHSKPHFYTDFHKDVFKAVSNLFGLKVAELRYSQQLENTRKYLDEILESPKDLIVFSLDASYRYKAFNQNHQKTMKAIWGCDIELGKSMLDYIGSGADRKKAKTNFDRALGGEEFTLTEAYGDASLQRTYWEDFYSPQKQGGNVVGVTVFVRDVSKELTYREALEESQSLIQSINSNIKDGVCRKSLKQGFVYTNNAMSKLFGYSQEEFKSISIKSVLNAPKQADEIVERLKAGETYNNIELLWKRKDGSTFWGLLNCRGFDKDGDYILDSSIVDITDIKQTQDKLQEKVNELEKLNSELDHLVYRTSHDLRAPVASILGLIELTELDPNFDPNDFRRILTSQVKRLDEIIRDIISYRKVAIQGVVLEQIDVEKAVQRVIDDNAFVKGSQLVTKEVVVTNPDNCPVVADQFSLNIVLNNLVSNAIKYADTGKEHSFVKIAAVIHKDKVSIEVADNGEGIHPKYHNQLFQMFFRASNSTFGSGLGLFILKEAVQKMKGDVRFESEPKVGTTFTIEFPNHSLPG